MNIPELKRILLVEDEPDIQTVAKLALEALGGYTIEICSSGHEALEKAPTFSPDLILLDVMMPKMDGPDTLRALRNVPGTSKTPMLFMTAKVQPHEVAEYQALGAIDVIAKPFDPMALASNLKEIWEQYHKKMKT